MFGLEPGDRVDQEVEPLLRCEAANRHGEDPVVGHAKAGADRLPPMRVRGPESIQVDRYVVSRDPFRRDAVLGKALDCLATRQKHAVRAAQGHAVQHPEGGAEERLTDPLVEPRPRQPLSPEKGGAEDDRAAVVHDDDRRSRPPAGQHGSRAGRERVLRDEDHRAGRPSGDARGRARDAPCVDPGTGEPQRVAEGAGQEHGLVRHARRGALLRHDDDAMVPKVRPRSLHHAERAAAGEARDDEDERRGDGPPFDHGVMGVHAREG